jgi:hypothetical protein
MLEQIQTDMPQTKVVYTHIRELINEWQSSKDEGPFWDYLGIPEYVFKEWLEKCRTGVYDT